MKKMKVGIIGCGNISGIYIKNCLSMFKNLELVAISDSDILKAEQRSKEFNDLKFCSVETLLEIEEIDAVINLTIPKAHAEVNLKVIEAKKHVYVEKPFATSTLQGGEVLRCAKEQGVRVGCAPDTFLGSTIQTAKKVIQDGWIGKPVAFTAFMTGHGPEGWHPDPEFFYKEGAGPLFDMGPYYLTSLVTLLGPIEGVMAYTAISFSEREIKSEPKCGKKIIVETPTHITASLKFKSGVIGTLVMSFDVWDSNLPNMEIYGSEGSLSLPDPNYFSGELLLKRYNSSEWQKMPLIGELSQNCRGAGLSQMAEAIQMKEAHVASGELGYHVLEVMEGILNSSKEKREIKILSAENIED